MYSLGFKLIRVGWASWALREIRVVVIIQGYCRLLKDIHFVWLGVLTMLAKYFQKHNNNLRDTCLIIPNNILCCS